MTRWTHYELNRLRHAQTIIQEMLLVIGTDEPGSDALIVANEDLANAELCATAALELEAESELLEMLGDANA